MKQIRLFVCNLNILKLNILAFLALSASQSFAETTQVSTQNVCTITINSKDEKEVFQKYLVSLGYNFIELTDFAPSLNQKDWFRAACKQKVQCDILVISGHFAGSFFGDTYFSLTLEELEKNVCMDECSGILKKPKEVFLFGCNTLAGKQPDNRTPERYRHDLVTDGFSASRAEAMVSYRYSPLGNSFHDRISRIFRDTPRIYGFGGKGPLGAEVRPMLERYFRSSLSYYSYENLMSIDKSQNYNFIRAMAPSPAVQAAGDNERESPMCYLTAQDRTSEEKLLWIESELYKENFLESIQPIQVALESLQLSTKNLTENEKQILNRIESNIMAKEKLMDFLKTRVDYLISVQISLIRIAHDFHWITSEEQDQLFYRIVWEDLTKPLSKAKRDELCGMDISLEVPKNTPDERYNESTFIDSVGCLKAQDEMTHVRIAQNLYLPSVERSVVLALGNMPVTNEAIQLELVKIFKAQVPWSREATWSLRDLKPKGEAVQLALADLLFHPALQIQEDASELLRHLTPASSNVQLKLAQKLVESSSNVMLWNLSRPLLRAQVTEERVKAMLQEGLNSPTKNTRTHSAEILSYSK